MKDVFIAWSQGRKDHLTCNEISKANWIGQILRRNWSLKHVMERRMGRKGDGKTTKKTQAATGW